MDSIPPSSETCFGQLTHYAGFDWAKDRHQIAVVDREGRVLLELSFEDTAGGWADLREKLRSFPKLGVAIETCCGPAVERLLEAGLSVYPLNPKAALRVGPGLLSAEEKAWNEPCSRIALPGATLVEDPLADVAGRHPLQ